MDRGERRFLREIWEGDACLRWMTEGIVMNGYI